MAANIMAANTTTLRQALTQNKPFVPCDMAPGRNTAAPDPPRPSWPDPTITIWDEFNLANLNESYGHVLDTPVLEARLPFHRADQVLYGISIERERDIKHLIRWNDLLMQRALRLAKSHLELYPGHVLCHRLSTADGSRTAKLLDKSHTFVVHHVLGLQQYPAHHFVVGLGRSSSKWDGTVLAAQPDTTIIEHRLPIRQLANICREARTRYGYVQTDRELVVCCFSRDENDRWTAAIMPIPWTGGGPWNLTSDLALWWLCMLAMSSSRDCAIVAEGDMIKINAWDTIYDNERGWVRRHCYSNFEKPTDPPSPLVYQTPSPSDQAAAAVEEAGMGLQVRSHQRFDFGDPADADHIDANHIDADHIDVDQMDVDHMGVDHALPRDHHDPAGSANGRFNMEFGVNVNFNVNFEAMADFTHFACPEDDPLPGAAANQ